LEVNCGARKILQFFPQMTFKPQEKYFMWKRILLFKLQYVTLDAICWRKCYTNILTTDQSLRCDGFNRSTPNCSVQYVAWRELNSSYSVLDSLPRPFRPQKRRGSYDRRTDSANNRIHGSIHKKLETQCQHSRRGFKIPGNAKFWKTTCVMEGFCSVMSVIGLSVQSTGSIIMVVITIWPQLTDWLWGPPSLFSGGCIPRGKSAGCDAYHTPRCLSNEAKPINSVWWNNRNLCKIWGFHGGDYEECRLLGCGAV
jgi:hypothetical protein